MPLLVQSKAGAGTSVSFAASTTAGNCVTASIGDVNVSSTPSVTAVKLGGAADNFAVAATATNTGSFRILSTIWADPNCAGGQTAVAITESNGSTPTIIAEEWSGLATSSVVDKTHTGTGTAASWSSGTTATTTQSAEAWVGAATIAGTAPTGPSSPWTNTSQASSSTDSISGQQVTSSTGTATYSGTGGGSAGWAAVVVTLLPSGASGSGTWDAGGTLTLSGVIAGTATWDAGGTLTLSATQSVTAAWDAGGTLTLAGGIAGAATWDAGGTLTMTGTTQVTLQMDAGGTLSLPVTEGVTAAWDAGGSLALGGVIAGQAAWDAGGSAAFGGTIAGAGTWDAGGSLVLTGQVGSGLPLHAGGTLGLAALVTAPTVVNQWAATFAQPSTFGITPPALQSTVIALTPATSVGGGSGTPGAGNWLFCIAGWNQAGIAPATVGDADDIHSFWRPGNVTTSTWAVSQQAASTRTSIWYTPNLARIPGDVYAAPNGAMAGMACLVLEVSGLGPWDTVTGIYASYTAAATALNLALAAPGTAAFLLAAVCGDSSAASQAFAPATWTALHTVTASNGTDHTCDAVLTSACVTTGSAVSVNASAGSAADLSGVIIGVEVNALSPIPAGANPAWAGRTIVEAALGSGFQTPPDQMVWTTLSDSAAPWGTTRRLWGWQDSSGVPYALGQLQSSTGSVPLDNFDGALTPSNTSSPYYPGITTGTPLRTRWALGGSINRWYCAQRFALQWPEKRNQAWRGYCETGLTDIWSVASATCPSPYRGEIMQDSPYAWWPMDDQPLAGGVLPTVLLNAADGNSNSLAITASPAGVTTQDAYTTTGIDATSNYPHITSVPPPSVAVYSVGALSGWMYGDPQSSPSTAPTGHPVTASPGSAAWQQTGAAGNTGSHGWFLAVNDSGFPQLSGGITVKGWFQATYLGTATGWADTSSGQNYSVAGQPVCPLTLCTLATASAPVAVLQLDSSGHLNLITYNGTSGTSHAIYSSSDLRNNAWTAVDITLTTTTWTVLVNGGLTASVSGTATGMTSAWSWLVINGDMGTSGGSSLSSIQHGGNIAFSHWQVFGSILPAWRLRAHYVAAVCGFGLLPAPQGLQLSAVANITGTGWTADGELFQGSYGGSTSVYTFSAIVAAVAGAYTSGPSARAVNGGIGVDNGGTFYGSAIYAGWDAVAPLVDLYTSAAADAETQAAVVAGGGDSFSSGYGSGASGHGPGQVSAGTGASPPTAATPLGDTVASRIERILYYGGILYPGRAIDQAGLLVQAARDVGGAQTGAGVQNIVSSDNGLLYVDSLGNLCYAQRSRLASGTVLWYLSSAGPSFGLPFSSDQVFENDPTKVWNAIAVSPYSPDGATPPVISPANASAAAASQAQYGARPQQVTSYLQSASEQQNQANWLLATYGQLARRVTGLRVDAATFAGAWTYVLGANVGDLVQVTDQPVSGAPLTVGTYRITSMSRQIAYGANGSKPEASLTITADPVPGSFWT